VRKTRLFEYGVLDPYTDCGVLSTEGVFRDGRYSNAGLLSTGSEFGAQNWAFCVREARGDGGGPERCAERPSRHPSKPREPALGRRGEEAGLQGVTVFSVFQCYLAELDGAEGLVGMVGFSGVTGFGDF
jgi:hypothetical protein